MSVVVVYSKDDCHLCADAVEVLERMRLELDFELLVVDIEADEELHRAYFERIPVVAIDGQECCEFFVQEAIVRERLESRR